VLRCFVALFVLGLIRVVISDPLYLENFFGESTMKKVIHVADVSDLPTTTIRVSSITASWRPTAVITAQAAVGIASLTVIVEKDHVMPDNDS